MSDRESAKGKIGFLLRDFTTGKPIFRIYENFSGNLYKEPFTDYDVAADIEIEIIDDFIDLVKTEKRNYLDYNLQVLGKAE